MKKVLYKPLSLGASVAGGLLAGIVFKQVWKLVSNEDDAALTAFDLGTRKKAFEVKVGGEPEGVKVSTTFSPA